MKEKKWLFYVICPVVFTLLMCAFLPGIYPAVRAIGSEWRAAWIINAPEYIYQQYKEEELFEESSDMLSVKRPSVGTQLGEIRCEKLGGTIPLYYGDHDEILELGAGIYTGYGFWEEEKSILIGAHDTTYFASLPALEAEDVIIIDTMYGNYKYQVTHTEIVDAADTLPEEVNEGTQELILYTCYPIGETEKVRTERYLVHAKEIPQTE